ncbi:MAG: aldehyde dehydrogenase family protein [Deltaproteobacteria bacterium]|nr:aldehyde dehydrogenase family protein [Deltaproteobacteria bacterium]
MQSLTKHFINGEFVDSHGTELVEIRDPKNNELIGRAIMGDAVDAERAIAAAKAALPGWSQTSLAERKHWLQRLADAVTERLDELKAMCIAEFGGLAAFSEYAMTQARDFFILAQATLVPENFEQTVNTAKVARVPLGVAGLLTPWNGNPWFVCGKAASALAAGCTVVIKPNALSALEAQVLMAAFHQAGLPAGVINVVNGRGEIVGNAITASRDVGMEAMRPGDPADPETTIQPMVTAAHWERVQRYIRAGIEEGAELVTGGLGKPSGLEAGNFVKPTLFAKVRNEMTIAQEEIFGPVLAMITYRDEDDAVAIANDVVCGLHAYIYGKDLSRARAIANRLQAGRVMINALVDDPHAPFGGFKMSGFGREFGVAGMQSFTEARAIFG